MRADMDAGTVRLEISALFPSGKMRRAPGTVWQKAFPQAEKPDFNTGITSLLIVLVPPMLVPGSRPGGLCLRVMISILPRGCKPQDPE
ncbi:hypothetical protein BG36_22965 [Aquamicrobium defluvii]|uniref:Uncharacterized protein n=1 Tax=Aquamicrobium defluvii TaxID=69279 RepID=A0A011VLG8_9HYPH|nr:hypothetical protein BG36_22965 [Aquamicrobium defluvii]EZQ17809.1 hypothetical protein CF98_30950 [Halopseudomonas bauzanensis]